MSGILAKLAEWFFKFLVMPLISKAVVWFISWYQERQAENKRNADIDAALEKYQNAKTPDEQEIAFKELIRRRRPRA